MAQDRAETLSTIRSWLIAQPSPEQLDDALRLCDDLAQQLPDDPEIQYVLGEIHVKRNEPAKAIEALQRSIALEPNNIHSRFLLVRCYSNSGRWQDAAPHAEHALNLQEASGQANADGNNLESISVLGTRNLYDGDLDAAGDRYDMVISFLEQNLPTSSTPLKSFDPAKLPSLQSRPLHPVLYLPIEIKARELEAKALLALAALEAGLTVVLGRTWVMSAGNYADLPPGIVLFKTLSALDANNMAIAKAQGHHAIVAIDEEAFGRSANKSAIQLNVDPLAVGSSDLTLLQGTKQLESWSALFPAHTESFVVTGNPKVDLFSHLETQGTERALGKQTILFCTMSGNVNPAGRSFMRTMEQTLSAGLLGSNRQNAQNLANLMRRSMRFEISIVPQLRKAIQDVSAAFPDADIVVRPHPVEDPALWLGRFDDCGNVRVETGGALTDWLKQSDVVVYVSGCGSGVEAALHGVGAVRFMGDGTVPDPDIGISTALNRPAQSSDDAIREIQALLTDAGEKDKLTPDDNNVEAYFHREHGRLVSISVTDSVISLYEDHKQEETLDLSVLENLRNRRTKPFPLKPFHLNKFPDTSATEIETLLRSLAAKYGFKFAPCVREIEDGLFLISNERERS